MVSRYEGGESLSQIAKRAGIAQSTVRTKLLGGGVSMRSVGEGVHLANGTSAVQLTTEMLEILDGLLLSDASLSHSTFTSRLSLGQMESHREWVDQVSCKLGNLGLENSVRIRNDQAGDVIIKGKLCHRSPVVILRTKHYELLKAQRDRWYPEGKKRVPSDIILTPEVILHWYMGDGTVGCKGYHAKFCTDGFPETDILMLIKMMEETFEWEPIREERNRILLCKTQDRLSLVQMLTEKIPSCFRYKLNLRTVDRRFKVKN